MWEDIRRIFDDLLSMGVFRDEEEIITRALQALFVAVSPHAKVEFIAISPRQRYKTTR